MNSLARVTIALLLLGGCAQGSEGSGSALGSGPSPNARDVDGCPVTVPERGFVPPKPYPSEPPVLPEPFRDVWYGNPGLWIMLDANGSVWDLPVAEDGHVGNKTLWFSENFTLSAVEDFSGDADVAITAVRLDGPAPPVAERGGVPSFNREIRNFMLVGLELPQPGCWEVTARYQGAELSYVLYVEDSRSSP